MVIKKEGNVSILELDKEITMETTAQIKQEIENLVNIGEKYIVFDLGKVEYLPSISVVIFTDTIRKISLVEGTLKIANVNNNVKKLLRSIKLLEILNVYKSVKSAINSF